MSINSKNQLLEYCQKNRLEFPIFISKQQIQGWVSECNFMGFKAISSYQPNKRIAEIEAAQLILLQLEQPQSDTRMKEQQIRNFYGEQYPIELPKQPPIEQKHQFTHDKKFVVLIDAENTPIEIKEVNLPIVYHVFYGFLAKLQQQFVEKYEKYAIIHKHKMAFSEATDHFMTFTIAELIQKGEIAPEKHEVIICSRDQSTAIQIQMLKDKGISAQQVASKRDFEDFIQSQIAQFSQKFA